MVYKNFSLNYRVGRIEIIRIVYGLKKIQTSSSSPEEYLKEGTLYLVAFEM